MGLVDKSLHGCAANARFLIDLVSICAHSGDIKLVYPIVGKVEQSSDGIQAGTERPVRTK